MKFSMRQVFLILLAIVVILIVGVFFILQNKNNFIFDKAQKISNSQSNISTTAVNPNLPLPPLPPQKLSNPPEIIKAVFVTGYSAGTKSYLNYLNELFKNTEINAVVVDIKGSDGYVTYNSSLLEVQKYKLTNFAIPDIDALVRFLHNQNIYVIGRISVFEDPVYSKIRPELAIYDKEKTAVSPEQSQRVLWKDNHKLTWLDPASKDVWDYNISLAKDTLSHGFDEINFDYIRFPSDGKTDNMGFPVYDEKISKAEIIKEFFIYLRKTLQNEKISVDMFGQTTVNKDDMGIGQLIESAFENFDYICPMVYPSHYINGFYGFPNPADHPYEVVKYSMDNALKREANFYQNKNGLGPATGSLGIQNVSLANVKTKFRPWLQDFNMGAYYTADMVKQEIKATQDSLGDNFSGFMLWNPSNKYTQDAILKQ